MKLRYLIICGRHKEEIEVSNWSQVQAWINQMVERFGPLDLLYRM
jgi:hypothetical protein